MKEFKFIPDEIIEILTKNKYVLKNSFSMFIDLSGFTSLTEKAIKEGKKGIENLIEILNTFFSKAIKIIYKNHGFIAVFHGDAMTAIFRGRDSLGYLLKTFVELKEIFLMENIKFKGGASFGNIKVNIYKNKEFYFYFSGVAIRNSAIAQSFSKSYELSVDNNFLNQIDSKYSGLIEVKKIRTDFSDRFYSIFFRKDFNIEKIDDLNKNFYKTNRFEINSFKTGYFKNKYLKNSFNIKLIIEKGYSGEFRNISTLFIKFKNLKSLNNSLIFIEPLLIKYGGYINSIEDADKGKVISIFFGAPVGVESPAYNALNFIDTLKNIFTSKNIEFRAGITYGTVFSGIIGEFLRATFTAIGGSVNLAARIMGKSGKWEINCDEKFFNLINKHVIIFKQKNYFLKGIHNPVKVFEIKKIKEKKIQENYRYKFCGRKKELKLIIDFINNKENKKDIMILTGTAGSGKTRIINEVKYMIYNNKNNNKNSKKNSNKNSYKNDYDIEVNNDKIKHNKINNNRIGNNRINDNEINNKINSGKKIQIFEVSFEPFQNEPFRVFKDFFNFYFEFFKDFKLSMDYEKIVKLFDLELKPETKDKIETFLNLVVELILKLSKNRRTLYIFDNIQWSDQYSQIILNKFLKKLSDESKGKIKTIMIYRGLPDCPDFFKNRSEIYKIFENINDKRIFYLELKGLSYNEFKEYLKINNFKISNSILDELYKKTRGNPLFIEHMLNYLMNRDLERIKIINLPEKLTDLIISRIDMLSHELKEMLKTASVVGINFNINILSYVLRRNLDLELLKNFESIEFIKSLSDIVYAFTHEIIRDAIYSIQLEKELKKVHYLIAKAIEKIYKNKIKKYIYELAFHYEKAGKIYKTKYYLKKCLNKVLENFLYLKVIDYCKKLLVYSDSINEKLKYYNILIESYINTGNFKEGENIIKEAINKFYKIMYRNSKYFSQNGMDGIMEILLKRGGENSIQFDYSISVGFVKNVVNFLIFAGLIYFYQSKYSDAEYYYHNALKLCDLYRFKKLKFKTLEKMVGIYFFKNKIEEAYIIFNKLLKSSYLKKEDSTSAGFFSNYAIILKRKGNYREAIKYYKKAINIALKLKLEPARFANNYFNLGVCYSEIDKHDLAKQNILKALKLFKKYNNLTGIAVCYDALGDIAIYNKRLSIALRYKLKAFDIEKKLNIPFYLLYTIITIANIYIEKRFLNKAKALIVDAEKMIDRVKNDEYREMLEIIRLKFKSIENPQDISIKSRYNEMVSNTKLVSFIKLINS